VEDLLFELQLVMPQVILGVINGAFYALLSLGLAVIFGMLNVINFSHGAQFTLGAFVATAIVVVAASLSPTAMAMPGGHGGMQHAGMQGGGMMDGGAAAPAPARAGEHSC
jgi:branched-subunit amino acid ABC-type transport system permease component